MEERTEWMRHFFKALTSKKISRNKNFAAFTKGWARFVHRRYRVMDALRSEVERLGRIPGTTCWVSEENGGLYFHLQCPRMHYKRIIALEGYEWEWLGQQSGVQALLDVKLLEG
jgi:hypothetical protein